ncbi:hypothetical protein [Mesorhizobium sp. IMUNJ 23232]|uniref:hypothetical protein n=1 Tax=Mesorhizobium sp. IMUNJ 23232 TaxID=3376064 RepID=UPI0037A31BB5
MSESPYSDQADALARWSLVQALWPPTLLVVSCVAHLLFTPAADGMRGNAAQRVALASGLTVFAFSAILLFDALLFRLMASYEDEQRGGAAVDDILARMRLKPTPPETRSLAARSAGTRRLVLRQRIALAVFILASGLPLLTAPP